MTTLPDIPMIHDERGFLAVAKPSGVATIPGRGIPMGESVRERLEVQLGVSLLPVHRLDRGTSGVLLFARDAATHRTLNGLFESRRVSKRYLAGVVGIPPSDVGRRERPLVMDKGERVQETFAGGPGISASTEWRVVSIGMALPAWGLPDAEVALLDVRPTTGRRHQIRVHLSSMGCPILGDPLYAHDPVRIAWPRLCLHASAIQFPHPSTGKPIEIRVSTPSDLPMFMQST